MTIFRPTRAEFDPARLHQLWQAAAEGLPHATRQERIGTGIKLLEDAYGGFLHKPGGDAEHWFQAVTIWQLLSQELSSWIFEDLYESSTQSQVNRTKLLGLMGFAMGYIPELFYCGLKNITLTIQRTYLEQITADLEALDQGEVRPLFRPGALSRRRDSNSYTLDELRVEALCGRFGSRTGLARPDHEKRWPKPLEQTSRRSAPGLGSSSPDYSC